MSSAKPNSAVQSAVNELLAELHAKSGCEKIGLTRESFAVILCEVGSKHSTAATSETEIRDILPEPASRRTRSGPRLRCRQATPLGRSSSRVFAKSSISRRCASRAKIPPRANWPTPSTPIFTAPTPARASAFPSSLPTPAADRWRAGCAPFWPRNTSIATAGRSAW